MPVGKTVIIIGGRVAAGQLAEFLVKRGRKVTMVETDENLGEGMVPERRNWLLAWFRKKGVAVLTGGIGYRKDWVATPRTNATRGTCRKNSGEFLVGWGRNQCNEVPRPPYPVITPMESRT